MCISSNRFLFLPLLLAVFLTAGAQTEVPEVRLHRHPLLDVYVSASVPFDFPIDVSSLTTDRSDLFGTGALAELGLGFHMPNNPWRPMVRLGYRYSNHSYVGSHYPGGMSWHWLSLNLQARRRVVLFGLESAYRLNSDLSHVPWDCLGFRPECFRRVTLMPYVGLAVGGQNLAAEWRVGYYVLDPIDKKQTAYYMRSSQLSIPGFTYELGLTYRIFTSGKRVVHD